MTDVRPAVPDDHDVVVDTVARAFVGDPAWEFMLGPDRYDLSLEFAHTLLVPRLELGTAWVAADGLAVAMWDRADDGPRRDMSGWWEAFAATAGPEVAARVEAYDAAVKAVAPARPYWYLGVLATHPDHQGRGLATAVVRPAVERAAEDGWDCWLETSKVRNKRFYQGLGFVQEVEAPIPGGPPTWWMGRPHQA